MTVNDLGSTIRNRMHDGLKGEIKNVSYSTSQLISEAFLLRSRLIYEESKKGKIDLTPFYQTFDSIPGKEMDISTHPSIKSGICTTYIEFPSVASVLNNLAVEYIGMNNKDIDAKSFTIYTDDRFKTHQNKLRIAEKPFTYLDASVNSEGFIKSFLFNIGPYKDKQYFTVRIIADNPMVFLGMDCCTDFLNEEFPAPGWMQDIIIERLSMVMADQYRKMNIPEMSNKQVDIKG